MVVEDLHDISLGRDILAHLGINDFVLGLTFVYGFLHHARADGSHLRTVVGVDDGRHDVTTKSGTNLIEQVVVVILGLDVVKVTDFELGAVGGEAAGQRGADARTEVATDDGGAHQANLRLFLLEEVDEDIGVRCRGVREQALAIESEQLIHAIRQDLVFHLAFDASASHDSVQFHAQLVGQFTPFGEQLLGDFGHLCAFGLDIYKYVVHYPIIFSSNNSLINPSTSESLAVRVLLSLA